METSGPPDPPEARPPLPTGEPAPGPPPLAPPTAPSGLSGGDWPAQATDAIVNLVGTVRDRTTGPVTTAARAAVFGLFVGVIVITIIVLLLIALVRLLDEVLPSGVWLAYLVLGLVFVGAGALVFRRRRAPTPH
jgi:hypothetical protein